MAEDVGKVRSNPFQIPQTSSYMYALMEAVQKDQATLSEQQVVDAQSTMNATEYETDIYNHWKDVLEQDAQAVTNAANKGGSNEASNVQAAQATYSEANAEAQMNESQQDAMVQSTQGQTQSDATNLQAKAQMQQSANTIMTTLVNLLGTITA